MTAHEYLDKTAEAVRSAFATIARYDELIEQDLESRGADHAARLEALAAWVDNPKVSPLVKPASTLSPDEGLSFARDALYGLIFQTAYQGLKLFSTNTTALPNFCVAGYGGAIPFMVGRQVRNVPLGLIIFAVRNHFNHLDLGNRLYEINLHVFRDLSARLGATRHQCSLR